MNWLRPFQSRAKVIDALTTKANSLLTTIGNVWDSRGGWFRVTEPYPGAWQENIELSRECVLTFPALFACITLIASDIAKLRVKLIEYDNTDEIWEETNSPSFSPVLSKPNPHQTRIQFFEYWVLSLLIWGNAYILKRRDNRGIVIGLYVLDPRRVHVQLATDGSVFYAIAHDYLNEVQESITVPSSEVIHDRMNCLFHPLCGLSPIFACGVPASTGIEIAKNATFFFKNGAKISGIITVPGALPQPKADALKEKFNAGYTGDNAGKVAVLADGAKFQPLTMNSTDAQMIEMLKITSEQVCSVHRTKNGSSKTCRQSKVAIRRWRSNRTSRSLHWPSAMRCRTRLFSTSPHRIRRHQQTAPRQSPILLPIRTETRRRATSPLRS
jgi:HK97 family phage portal protein